MSSPVCFIRVTLLLTAIVMHITNVVDCTTTSFGEKFKHADIEGTTAIMQHESQKESLFTSDDGPLAPFEYRNDNASDLPLNNERHDKGAEHYPFQISFLTPTRQRAWHCMTSLTSLISKAQNRRSFEVLFAFDDDDDTYTEILDFCEREQLHCKHMITKRFGYGKLHAYLNSLAKAAEGEYLWLWNDDVLMETDNWDAILATLLAERPGQFWDIKNNHHPFTFPLVPKKYIDAIGHFALNSQTDSWIQLVFQHHVQLSIETIVSISLFHNRGSEKNPMQIDYSASHEAMLHEGRPDFYSNFGLILRMLDGNRVIRKFFTGQKALQEIASKPPDLQLIAFVGLGRVGLPMAAGIAAKGHLVLGFDWTGTIDEYSVRKEKFSYMEAGPDGRGEIGELLDSQNFKVTTDISYAVEFGEYIIVTQEDVHQGGPHSSQLEQTLLNIFNVCTELQLKRTVIVVSATLPEVLKTIPPSSAYVSLCYQPLSVTPGTILRDLYEPPFVLFGCDNENARPEVERLFRTITKAPMHITTIANAAFIEGSRSLIASMNSMFVNYLMEVCDKTPGADVDEVISALQSANGLPLSSSAMGGFGDSTSVPYNMAMSWLSSKIDVKFDLPQMLSDARKHQTEYVADIAEQYATETGLEIVVLGKAAKPDTRTTHNSQALFLFHILKLRRDDVSILDPLVDHQDLDLTSPAVYIIGTGHTILKATKFPPGSVVVDPYRYIPARENIHVHHIGGKLST